MGRKRRHITREFKAEAVRLCRVAGRTIPDVAGELDLTETSLRSCDGRQLFLQSDDDYSCRWVAKFTVRTWGICRRRGVVVVCPS
jgi:hypothetical protein